MAAVLPKAGGLPAIKARRQRTLPDDVIERTCVLTIVGPDEMAEDIDELYELYVSGDADALLAYLEEETEPIGGDGLIIEVHNHPEKALCR